MHTSGKFHRVCALTTKLGRGVVRKSAQFSSGCSRKEGSLEMPDCGLHQIQLPPVLWNMIIPMFHTMLYITTQRASQAADHLSVGAASLSLCVMPHIIHLMNKASILHNRPLHILSIYWTMSVSVAQSTNYSLQMWYISHRPYTVSRPRYYCKEPLPHKMCRVSAIVGVPDLSAMLRNMSNIYVHF